MTTRDSSAGSIPEFMVFNELQRRGLRQGVDFYLQAPIFGGRIDRGGYVLDFLFSNPPGLAINVQGEYYHYGLGTAIIARDRLLRAQMAGQGVTLIFIDESDILDNVEYYVGEALNFKDHSRLA